MNVYFNKGKKMQAFNELGKRHPYTLTSANSAAIRGSGKLVKGSAEAKARMAYLRSLRKTRTRTRTRGSGLISGIVKTPYKMAKGIYKVIKLIREKKAAKAAKNSKGGEMPFASKALSDYARMRSMLKIARRK